MKEQLNGGDFASFADDDEWVEAIPVVAVGNGGGGGANWAAFGSSYAEDDTEWQSFAQPAGTSVNTGSHTHVAQSAPIEASQEAAKERGGGGGGSGSTNTLSASLFKECFRANHLVQSTESPQVLRLVMNER